LSKRSAVYAAPEDRDNLTQGAYLIALRGVSARDTPRNRQRVLDHILDQLDRGLPPFEADSCFPNGLSERDLIYIPQPEDFPMSHANSETLTLEQQDIVIAANEIIELAKLKVDLASAYRAAQQYKALVTKIVAVDGGHLTDEECQIVGDKGFVKSIKGIAEAKVKVSQWYQNASGKHELILNELNFLQEEIAEGLALENGKAQDPKPKATASKSVKLETASAEE
jgi:hypothetical protein